MNEILEILVGLLCPGDATYSCEQFLYPYEGNTLLQVLWFAFFPMLFVILFTYILSDAVAKNAGGKFKVIIGMAVVMLVIIQGWYPYVLVISKWWWIALILMGGLYIITHKMGVKQEGGGGGGHGQVATAGVVATTLFGSSAQALVNPHHIGMNRKLCDDKIKELEAQIAALDLRRNAAREDKEKSEYAAKIAEFTAQIVFNKRRKAEGLPPV